MKEFMLIFRHEMSSVQPTVEQIENMTTQWRTWIAKVAKSGNFSGTNRLLPEGKTLHAKKSVTDGPFVEGKEMIGGYLIVKANSLNDAVEIAKGCPGYNADTTIEIRSVMQIDSDPASKTFLGEKMYA